MIETLLRLSDYGHFQAVVEIFKVPLQQCPDVLVFGLLQSVCGFALRVRILFSSFILTRVT